MNGTAHAFLIHFSMLYKYLLGTVASILRELLHEDVVERLIRHEAQLSASRPCERKQCLNWFVARCTRFDRF